MQSKEKIVIACINPLGIYGTDASGKPSIPWCSKKDLEHFKKETIGHTLIVGVKTIESLPRGKDGNILPDRELIVVASRDPNDFKKNFLTRNKNEDLKERFHVYASLREAIEKSKTKKVFIGGGGNLWTQALPFANVLLITMIDINISETNREVSCKALIDPTIGYPFELVEKKEVFEYPPDSVEFKLTFRKYERILKSFIPLDGWWSEREKKNVK